MEPKSYSSRPFAYQLLPHLARVVPHSELAKLRLICRSWNAVIANIPDYLKHEIKFTKKTWQSSLAAVQYDNCIVKWQRVQIRTSPVFTDKFFTQFWNIACCNIVNLIVHNVKLRCSHLTQFLHQHCPYVRTLALNLVHYIGTELEYFEHLEQPGILYCDHDEFSSIAPTRPTITNITITSCYIHPTCILDILRAKSAGRLASFTYKDAKIHKYVRAILYPTEAKVHSKILALLSASMASLKQISWLNNINGTEFFDLATAMVQAQKRKAQQAGQELSPDQQEPQLRLKSFKFREFVEAGHYRRIPTAESAFEFIKVQAEWLQELEIHQGCPTLFMAHLPDLFRTLKSLRSLKITLLRSEDEMSLGFIIYLDQLQVLKVVDKSIMNVAQRLAIRAINTTYIPFIQVKKLTSLWLTHRTLSPADILGIINRCSLYDNLVQLVLKPAITFDDGAMQAINEKLTGLKKLIIYGTLYLTDCGITGLHPETVEALHKYKCEHVLSGCDQREDPGWKHHFSLRRLKDLEHLSFRKCTYLTNTAIASAFYFPKLRFVDLSWTRISDSGLAQLALSCPNLEDIVLLGRIACTNSGLNMCLFYGRKIKKIYVDLKTANNMLGNTFFKSCPTHPDFKNIICFDQPPWQEIDSRCYKPMQNQYSLVPETIK